MKWIKILILKKLRKEIAHRSGGVQSEYFMCLILTYTFWYLPYSENLIKELREDRREIPKIYRRSITAWYDNRDYQSRLDNIDRTIKRLSS